MEGGERVFVDAGLEWERRNGMEFRFGVGRTEIPDVARDLVEPRLSQPDDARLAPRGSPRGFVRGERLLRPPRARPVLARHHRVEPIFPRLGEFRRLGRPARRERCLCRRRRARRAPAPARARHQHDRRASALRLDLRGERDVRLEHLALGEQLLVLLEHAGQVEEFVHEVSSGEDGAVVHGDLVPVLPVFHIHDAQRVVVAGRRHRAFKH